MANKFTGHNRRVADTRPNAVNRSKKAIQMKKNIESGNGLKDNCDKRGRKGYAEKAYELGLYNQICVDIQLFREENDSCSYIEVYANVLHSKYSQIFHIPPEKMYASNVSKLINSDKGWANAYFCTQTRLFSQVKLKMAEMIDNMKPGDIIKAYDILARYDIENKKLQAQNQEQSSYDVPTFTLTIQGGKDGNKPE